MSDLTIYEKNCTIPLGKLSNQSILEISLNNLSIKLISVPRYEKKQILQNPPESELRGYLGHATTLLASAVWII